jgi:hypothetical protein
MQKSDGYMRKGMLDEAPQVDVSALLLFCFALTKSDADFRLAVPHFVCPDLWRQLA